MSDKPKILIQFDPDQHPSVFDSVVAIDAGVDHLLPFGSVEPVDVRNLVHGAMFTRGGSSLKNTAIFIGGSRVPVAEQLLRSVTDSFFGPVRVSVMLDANGANTTAVAAVLSLQKHMDVRRKTIAVLASTGSVGSRVARLLGIQGATVRVASRSLERARALCERLNETGDSMPLEPWKTDGPADFEKIITGCDALISAGAAGIQLLNQGQWQSSDSLHVAIDLNAVPPSGVEGIDPLAAAGQVGDIVTYGAIGVGNLKMKIHKRCIQALFEANDQVLDVDEIFRLGRELTD